MLVVCLFQFYEHLYIGDDDGQLYFKWIYVLQSDDGDVDCQSLRSVYDGDDDDVD